ncbi:MAG: cold-shock protein [Cohaesibacteraceae bacterium]|nr:cold-shock protein [Cohaesibacteraceae bacterium]MBL4875263.1 cold-shock protein [Cohaesibacteraceae bacterium]
MPTGTVKWFNETKGYGFIVPEEGGNDIFVHIRAIQRSGLELLTENQIVEFDLVTNKRSGKSEAGTINVVKE